MTLPTGALRFPEGASLASLLGFPHHQDAVFRACTWTVDTSRRLHRDREHVGFPCSQRPVFYHPSSLPGIGIVPNEVTRGTAPVDPGRLAFIDQRGDLDPPSARANGGYDTILPSDSSTIRSANTVYRGSLVTIQTVEPSR